MNDSIKGLFERLNEDTDFAARFGALDNEQELSALLAECGLSINEFKAGHESGMRSLEDAELDTVAGGSITAENENGDKSEFIFSYYKRPKRRRLEMKYGRIHSVSAEVEMTGELWSGLTDAQGGDDSTE